MALYAIGDLHLSLGVAKPMDVFGGVWEGYTEKLKLKKHNRLLKHCLEEAAHLPMSRLLKSLLLMQKVK